MSVRSLVIVGARDAICHLYCSFPWCCGYCIPVCIWMAIISGGRLFQALMLLGRNENVYASVLARRLMYDSVCRVRKASAYVRECYEWTSL